MSTNQSQKTTTTTRNYVPAEMYNVPEYINQGDICVGSGVPTDTPADGDSLIYQDEDTGNLYLWFGSSWGLLTSGGIAPVISVFGRTGAIASALGDYTDVLIQTTHTPVAYAVGSQNLNEHLQSIDGLLNTLNTTPPGVPIWGKELLVATADGQTVFTLATAAVNPDESTLILDGYEFTYSRDFTIAGTVLTINVTNFIIENNEQLSVKYRTN